MHGLTIGATRAMTLAKRDVVGKSDARGRRMRTRRTTTTTAAAGGNQDPILLRAARGEDVERPPVWLMRQAGRYMAEFRAYSTKYGFRHRSETPEIAIELSMQPWRAFKPDGVIMFSDILTPLPALGIEFDVVKGKGPVVTPVRTMDDVKAMKQLDDPDSQLPFVREILSTLRKEIEGQSTMLGFIGSPWTLAAYAMEGSSDRHLVTTKQIMTQDPETLHAFLSKLADALGVYVCHQIDSGAQVVQIFDSWAHHLSPQQYLEFSHPYNERVIAYVKQRYPDTPLIFHANGGCGKLHELKKSTADVIGLDWNTSMSEARAVLGPDRVLQGNMDPMYLFASPERIRQEVANNVRDAGSRKHILNVGHGVVQGTPEENVGHFCDAARASVYAPKAVAR
jgi:uroporphyrinogen decarboxylase|tara:strand:+ start:184 stop:1368 length:1185 start_codon:yes stop_codon:yes gene_type:complete